jgi:methoxymalonate biosynthesis acyl carrier protein
MQTKQIPAAISTFLRNHIRVDHLDPDKKLFSAGYVNSLFALQLVTFVEKTFSIRVENEDLDIENFDSVTAIDRFVRRKLQIELDAAT